MRSKSLFITTYITLLHLFSIFALYQIYQFGINWSLAGVLLASLPGALFFDILLSIQPAARTKPHLLFLTIIKLSGLLLVILFSINSQTLNFTSLLMAFSGFTGWLIYDYWYSSLPDRNNTILAKGNYLPNLTFQKADKTTFETNQLKNHKTLYIFYRGNWCPLCMAQIDEIAEHYHQLAKQNVSIMLISPQSHKNTQKLAEKFDLPFLFLIDENNQVARQLGIIAENGLPLGLQVFGYESDTVMPTVIMTDEKGKILFADLTDNYRVRPEPSVFLQILADHHTATS